MPENVVFVSHSSELNGAELMLLELIECLDEEKFSKILVAPRDGPLLQRAKRAGIETHIIHQKWWLTPAKRKWQQPLNWLWNLKGLGRLVGLIRNYSTRVVVSNSSVAFAGALAARIAGRPHIWIIHELLHHPQAVVKFIFGNRLLVRIIGRLSAKVIVNSKKTGEAFFPDFPVEIITNGINWSRLARETHQLILFKNLKIVDRNLEKVKEKEELTRLLQRRKEIQSQIRVKWNLNHQDQFLGVVGKLKREKGQDLAIYALARLKEIFPRLKLLFIGEPADKVYYSYLRHLLKKLGLEKRVVFLGYVKELYSLLLGLDILLVPSRQESFGRVIIEAMAVGVPVVAFRQGGIEEIIKDGHNGYLARDFSAESLGEKVSLLLSEPFLAGKFMIEGYRTVRTKYDLHNQVKKFEGILEQWIG